MHYEFELVWNPTHWSLVWYPTNWPDFERIIVKFEETGEDLIDPNNIQPTIEAVFHDGSSVSVVPNGLKAIGRAIYKEGGPRDNYDRRVYSWDEINVATSGRLQAYELYHEARNRWIALRAIVNPMTNRIVNLGPDESR